MEDVLKERKGKKNKPKKTAEELAAEAEAKRLAEEKEANSSAARRRARSERRMAEEAQTAAKGKGGAAASADGKGADGKGAEGSSANGKGKGALAAKPARVTRRTSSRNAPTPENNGPTEEETAGLKKGVAINLQKLRPKMEGMKADFIVIKLHYQCSCCHQYILFGNVWRKPKAPVAIVGAIASSSSAAADATSGAASGTATPRIVELGAIGGAASATPGASATATPSLSTGEFRTLFYVPLHLMRTLLTI